MALGDCFSTAPSAGLVERTYACAAAPGAAPSAASTHTTSTRPRGVAAARIGVGRTAITPKWRATPGPTIATPRSPQEHQQPTLFETQPPIVKIPFIPGFDRSAGKPPLYGIEPR